MDDAFDLVIIGSGSGNSLVVPEMDGWRIAVVERGVFGGTCLNRGCIPSKMLIYPADRALEAADSSRLGLSTTFAGADWPAIVERVFGRIDPISSGGRRYRESTATLFETDARFVGERTLDVGGRTITAERIVIAAGSRPFIPPIPGLDDDAVQRLAHTSDTIMRLPELPRRLVVLGGGYIAAELAHVFGSLGSAVTVVNRSARLLMHADEDISAAYTDAACGRYDLHLGARVERVEPAGEGVVVHLSGAGGARQVEGDVLLLALGRIANGDQLDAERGGVRLGPDGEVVVDAYGRTSAAGVWALGDVNGRYQLKHMANGEAQVIAKNLVHPDDLQPLDPRPAPHAVFGHPQIGGIGLTESEALDSGGPVCVVRHPFGSAAYGWAMEDTEGFVKLIGDPRTRRLLGAHVLGHQASVLVQLLVQGMHLGNTVDEMAGQVWIHPALSEVVEQALLALIDDFDDLTGKISCSWVNRPARGVSPEGVPFMRRG